MDKARFAAYEILNRIERDSAYSNLLLKSYFEQKSFDGRDAAFTHTLVNGVLERLYTLDYLLSLCLKQPLKKLKPQVLVILRLGAYQILFMDRVPVQAAVNESVNISKKAGCSFASGLINAVLRNVAANGIVYPEKEADIYEYYKIKYSFPRELSELLVNTYGRENAEGIMEDSLGKSRLFGRVNTFKTSFSSLKKTLEESGAEIIESGDCHGAFEIKANGNIAAEKAFKDGLFYIQDLSSQLCCAAIAPKPGDTVIDVCAAPGTKSFTLAMMMENKGKIISCDIHSHKLKLIEEGAGRLGINIIETRLRDAAEDAALHESADYVLCDVPCSGFGVIGRKPEIKYKSMEELRLLTALQLKILENSARLLKKGGILTYSTCTLNPAENIGVCESFMKNNASSFRALRVLPDYTGRADGDFLTLLPHVCKSDGFFTAQFERIV